VVISLIIDDCVIALFLLDEAQGRLMRD
jgi:hypothetical protein